MAQKITTHTVAPGETLATIASKYGLSEEALKEANPETKKHLYTGMELAIPDVKKSDEQPVVTPAPVNSVTTSENKETIYSTPKSDSVNYSEKEGNGGKVCVAGEAMFNYLIPSLGDASEYMEANFSCGMSLSVGARFYPTDNFYVEGMAGWKWLLESISTKGSTYSIKTTSTYHYVTLPFHLGMMFPSRSKTTLGLFAGTRIDIPVSSKSKIQDTEKKVDMPVTALLEVGLDIKFNSDNILRLQYSYSPSERHRYSLLSIGWSVGI